MELLGEIRLITGAYEDLIDGNLETTFVGEDADSGDGGESGKETGKRIRIAGGKYYDVLLHVLPKGARYQHKWPEGSWTIVQPLTGLTEVAQLRGPDRDGFYSKMRPRDIRGGGDGSGSLGTGPTEGAEGYSTAGESCVKYLGGPLRSYTGKAMKSALLEVVVRPPIEVNVDATGAVEDLEWESAESVLTRVVPTEVAEGLEDEEKDGSSDFNRADEAPVSSAANNTTSSTGLNQKLGVEFENVGGLDAQLDDIARRVLASRANPAAARRLGVSHVRGILLSVSNRLFVMALAYQLNLLLISSPRICRAHQDAARRFWRVNCRDSWALGNLKSSTGPKSLVRKRFNCCLFVI